VSGKPQRRAMTETDRTVSVTAARARADMRARQPHLPFDRCLLATRSRKASADVINQYKENHAAWARLTELPSSQTSRAIAYPNST
jgi:hypothetical protein